MTATVIIRGDDMIVVASDGAAYDNERRLLWTTSKVVLIPEASSLIASRGSSMAAEHVRSDFFWAGETATFDRFIVEAPRLAREAHDKILATSAPWADRFSLFLCGFSEARQRAETYVVRSRDHEEGAAYEVVPLRSVHMAPPPHPEAARAFGVDSFDPVYAGEMSSQEYASRTICACRYSAAFDDYPEGETFVGGFVQVALVARQFVQSHIVHRWADVPGTPLDWRVGTPGPGMAWSEEGLPVPHP